MGDNQYRGKRGIKNIQSLETTRRQLRCESSKNSNKNKELQYKGEKIQRKT